MKNLLVVLLVGLVLNISYSQDDGMGTIDAQRPTLTESYSIVKKGILQFENGLDFYFQNSTLGYGTFVRGSFHERIELRFFTDYRHFNSVGAKFIITEPNDVILGIGSSIVMGYDILNNTIDARLALTRDSRLFFGTYNLGYNGSIYNIVLFGVHMFDKWNYFIEYFNQENLHRIHSGFTYIPQRDIQVDINGGWINLNGWYAGIGLSFRLRSHGKKTSK